MSQGDAPLDQTRLAAMEGIFSPEECRWLIDEYKSRLEPALVEDLDLAESSGVRKSSAVFVAPDERNGWVFERLDHLIRDINASIYGFDVAEFREGFQFTCYEVGEYYGPHFDIGAGRLSERKLSATVQLSDPADYTGGELVVYPEFIAAKDQGSMTVFPSFMCHNVYPVKSGVRYSLVAWLSGPQFR